MVSKVESSRRRYRQS